MWIKDESMKSEEALTAKEAVIKVNNDVDKAKNIWEQAQKSMSKFYDCKQKEQNYRVRDLVLLSSQNIRMWRACKKLADQFLRLFKVEKVINLNVYKLKLSKQYSRIHPTFHVSLLKSYRKRSEVESSESVIVKNIEEYIVECVLNTHKKQGKCQYLIKWESYSPVKNMWEPLFNLENALKMIQEFEEMHNVSSEALVKNRWNTD